MIVSCPESGTVYQNTMLMCAVRLKYSEEWFSTAKSTVSPDERYLANQTLSFCLWLDRITW